MTPDLARSVAHRIRNNAAERGVDPARVRRHVVFHRILTRLAPTGRWVLKGGFCLEARLDLRSRATQDLDMALLSEEAEPSALDVQDLLTTALEIDATDGFAFRVALPHPISADELGNPGWRVKVTAVLDGTRFEEVKLDVVSRPGEIVGGTESLAITPPVPGLGHDVVVVPAVDIAQHAAEKAHAYARVYAHNRPSSRVKDLVDLVLLIETGLLLPLAWGERLRHVFAVRDDSAPPDSLPLPPASWTAPYAALAAELETVTTTSADAWSLVNERYLAAIRPPEKRTP